MEHFIELIHFISSRYLYINYLSIPFVIFFITVVPVPFPEDFVTIAVGYLSYNNYFNYYIAFPILFVSIIISDTFLYFLGSVSEKIILKNINKNYISIIINKDKLNKGIFFMNKFGMAAIFLARFIFGLRSVTFIACGFLEVGFKKFIFINLFAGLFQISLLFFAGYYFHGKIDVILNLLAIEKKFLGVILVVVLGVIIIKKIKNS